MHGGGREGRGRGKGDYVVGIGMGMGLRGWKRGEEGEGVRGTGRDWEEHGR